MRNLLVCGPLMIVAAVFSCNARSLPPQDASVRLDTVAGRPLVDGVFLNGHGPYRFLIDTGAQTNQVDSSIALKLGLTPEFRVAMATVAGTVQVAGCRSVAVSLGPATASNQEFLFTTLGGVHALAPDVQGVLGQEFLSHFDYLLDLAHHRLFFGDLASSAGSHVRFDLIDGRPAIATSVGKLVLDSGTDTLVLLRGPSSSPIRTLQTASGLGSVSAVESVRLEIAGRGYRGVRAVTASQGSLGEDGELPMSLFHAVYFSNSGKYAILDPRR